MIPKNSTLLMVGATGASGKRHEAAIRGGLQGMDRQWVCTSTFAPTIPEAIAMIPALKRLEVVLLEGDLSLCEEELCRGMAELAKAINAHPNHPWVAFATPELERLGPIFQTANVFVECGMVERVIHERWAFQVRAAA